MSKAKTAEQKAEEKQKRIRQIMDNAALQLEKENVKFFIGVTDRDDPTVEGGKAYSKADCNGEDFTVMLNLALPTRQDIVNLGIWVGTILNSRKQNVNISN